MIGGVIAPYAIADGYLAVVRTPGKKSETLTPVRSLG